MAYVRIYFINLFILVFTKLIRIKKKKKKKKKKLGERLFIIDICICKYVVLSTLLVIGEKKLLLQILTIKYRKLWYGSKKKKVLIYVFVLEY